MMNLWVRMLGKQSWSILEDVVKEDKAWEAGQAESLQQEIFLLWRKERLV